MPEFQSKPLTLINFILPHVRAFVHTSRPYCGNSPLNYVDPSCELFFLIPLIAAAIGAASGTAAAVAVVGAIGATGAAAVFTGIAVGAIVGAVVGGGIGAGLGYLQGLITGEDPGITGEHPRNWQHQCSRRLVSLQASFKRLHRSSRRIIRRIAEIESAKDSARRSRVCVSSDAES